MPRAALHPVSLKEANQQFSRLIRKVERGQGFVITRRGRPVARILPHRVDRAQDPEWIAAYDRLVDIMEEGIPIGGPRVGNRGELHDRGGRLRNDDDRRAG